MLKLKEYLRKTSRFMQMWEGVWVIPMLGILTFIAAYAVIIAFGPDAGQFPPGLTVSILIGALIVFSGATVSNLIVNLYHRGWFRYYYDTKENSRIKRDFRRFPKWARIIFVPVLQVIFLLAYVYVVCQLI